MLIDNKLLQQLRYSLKSPLFSDGARYVEEPGILIDYIPIYRTCLTKEIGMTVAYAYTYDSTKGYLCGERGTKLKLKSKYPPDDLIYEERFDNTYWLTEKDILSTYGGWPSDIAKIISTWLLKRKDVTFEMFFRKLVSKKGDYAKAMNTLDIQRQKELGFINDCIL
jgi:hypothetical protein